VLFICHSVTFDVSDVFAMHFIVPTHVQTSSAFSVLSTVATLAHHSWVGILIFDVCTWES